MRYDLDDPGLLFREDVLADPRLLYAQLRQHAPIWKLRGQDTFLVSDPTLIRDVVGRPDDFSSNMVSMIHRGGDGHVAPFAMLPFRDPHNVLAVADPPDHTRHRKLLQNHLTPAAVAALEPVVRELTVDRLRPLIEDGHGDAVTQLADPIPSAMICELLGLPVDDLDLLISHILGVGVLLDGMADEEGMTRAGHAAIELATFTASKLDGWRERPPADRTGLMDALLDAIERDEVTRDEAVGMLMQLFTAGTETTQSLTATTIELLAVDSDLQDRLRRDPTRIPNALEDVLRTDGPFQFHYRWAPVDTALDTTPIPAGSRVLLLWSAANQDVEPHGPGERRGPHFAFGRGIHFCIGAALARLEARVIIEELLAGTTSFRLDPHHLPSRRPSIMLRRHASLPILAS